MTAIYRLCSTKQKVLQYQSAITKEIILKSWKMGRGGSQVVSVLAFYSNDPGLNPAIVIKRQEIVEIKFRKQLY